MLKKILKDLIGSDAKPPATPLGARSFMPEYERTFAPHLNQRAESFRVMLEKLEEVAARRPGPLLIIETGSMREVDDWGAGQSTLLWKAFSAFHQCEIHTVDLNPDTTALVKRVCGEAVHAHTRDSVAFLYDMANAKPRRHIDLLYLDSYDFNPEDPFPSAMHHILELIAIRPCLGEGSLVAIDDNFVLPDGSFTGKGYLALQWFRHLNISSLHLGYQFVWQL